MKLGVALALLSTAISFTLSVTSAAVTNEPLIDFASPYTVSFAEHISATELPAGRSLTLATMSVRISGYALLNQNGSVSRGFVQDVSELPTFPNASAYFIDILRAVPAEPAPAYYATATAALPEEVTPSTVFDSTVFESVDLQMSLNVFRNAYLVDFGATTAALHAQQLQALRSSNYTVDYIVQLDLDAATVAVPYLKRMPLPQTASYNFTLQVFSNMSLCCKIEPQSLLLSVTNALLANQTNLIALSLVNTTTSEDAAPSSYAFSANFTFVTSMDVYTPLPSLETALSQITVSNTSSSSAFTQAMLDASINATATSGSIVQFLGNSFTEQVSNYMAENETPREKEVPIGWPIGASLGSLLVVGVAVWLSIYVVHQRQRNRLQQAKLDSELKLKQSAGPGLLGAASNGSMSHSRQLSSIPFVGIPSSLMQPGWAVSHAWDLDPSEVLVCKRPDGSDWLLGTGSFGQVVKGLRGGVQDVALKMLLGDTHYHVNSFRQEIEILKSLSFDRNIVQFYGTCPWNGKTMLVLEFMEGGDLRQALTAAAAELFWYNKGASVALDIIKGVHFLHQHKVIHMDMKPKNVLLTADYSIAKVADVGLAHIMGGGASAGVAQGTFAYAAPEQLLNQHCDEKVDIYSFGVLLWELVTATPPMRGRLRPIKVPAECPQEIADLVDACLSMDPQLRPSARDVFDVISRVKSVQDEQAAQDPWQFDHAPEDTFHSLHSQHQSAASRVEQDIAGQPGQAEASQSPLSPTLDHMHQDGSLPQGTGTTAAKGDG